MQGTNFLTSLRKIIEVSPENQDKCLKTAWLNQTSIGENAIQLSISGHNIKTIGGDNSHGITRTSDFLKDMGLHMVILLN